jgi:hypothetical protein
MTYSIIPISKIKPYNEYKNEFNNTKKQKLINAIQIADKINKGEMTYEQHYHLCKKGIDSFQKQSSYIEKQKIKDIIKLNLNKNDNKKEYNLLGNKRNNSNSNNNNNNSNYHELVYLIEDFIYNKKIIPLKEYKSYFDKMKIMIQNNKINNNIVHLLIKLLRFLNSSRNFNQQIVSMDYFIDLQNVIKDKLISTIFDSNNLLLEKENIELINVDELIQKINDYNKLKQNSFSNNSIKKNHKNKMETNEESIEDSSNGSKFEENKSKINITPLNQLSLFELFNSFENNNNNLNKNSINNDDIIEQIKKISKIKCNNDNIKKSELRKKVCLKLYNVFEILLKKLNISKSDIQNLCIGIECKARNYDNEMSTNYKNYITDIFKLIKQYFI